MRFLFYSIFLISFTLINAQGFKVRHSIPNASNNCPRAFFEINPGSYLGAGFAIDTSSGQSINQIVIVGLGSQGQLQWTKKHKGHKMEYLNNGFIQRCFYKKDNFLYYAGCATDTAGAQIGVFIKFNLNGDTIWQKICRDSVSIDLIPQMVTSSVDGGFLMTGFFQDLVNHTQQGLILKTDANGNELWRRKINKLAPNVQDGKAILQDSASKKIVIVGYQYLNSAANYDNILILDSLGNKLTQKHFTNFGGNAYDLLQTADKKFVMVGNQMYSQTTGGYNCQRSYAIKFDVDTPQNPLWKIDGFDKLGLYNGFTCAIELKNGNLLLGGYLDTLQGVCNGPNNQPGNLLPRLTMINKNGAIIWNRYYNYKTNSVLEDNGQVIHSLNICQDGCWLGSIETQNFPGTNPMLFVKYDSTGCDSSLAYCSSKYYVGLHEQGPINQKFEVYPNPFKDVLKLESDNPEELEYLLKDIFGKEILKGKVAKFISIDVSYLKGGMYLLSITKDKEVIYTTKIIKED
jgi:hypothetical protein